MSVLITVQEGEFAIRQFTAAFSDFIRRIHYFGCPLPCSFVGYKVKVSYKMDGAFIFLWHTFQK